MSAATFRVTTLNLSREHTAVIYPLSPEVFWRRVEITAQGLALQALGQGLPGGGQLRMQAACIGHPDRTGGMRIESMEISVCHRGEQVEQARVEVSRILALETRALVDALALHHNIFRHGDRAICQLGYTANALPAPAGFSYLLPECDPALEAEGACLTARAAEVIGYLVRQTDDTEQRAFAVGVLGRSGVPLVTDVIVPAGAAEGASRAGVDFSPEDWAWAQQAVDDLGPPFRILGPCHTHPYGALAPSAVDWELFTWAGGADALFIIAAQVGRQPVAAGYRWIAGSLEQVDLRVEAAQSRGEGVEEEAGACLEC